MNDDNANDFNGGDQVRKREFEEREASELNRICPPDATIITPRTCAIYIAFLRAAGWQITDPITHEEQTREYAASLDNDPFKD